MADEYPDKKFCGAFVVMKSGKRYLFEEGATLQTDGTIISASEKGSGVFTAPIANVECWGWNTWFFKDAWWGKQ